MIKATLPIKIKKRSGEITVFNRERIKNAVERASFDVLRHGNKSKIIAENIIDKICGKISGQFANKIPDVETVQDIVEMTLMEEGYNHIAKSYILYRKEREDLRYVKSALGVKDDLKLSINAMQVLKKRYLLKDENQNIIETPSEMFRRVASHVAQGEMNYKRNRNIEDTEEEFFRIMRDLVFLPNSPTLMNAGTRLGQLSACFVIPVEDSMDDIFKALHDMAIIHQTGGGTGFDFSSLRPKGDIVSSTKAQASGPVSFMNVFDKATNVIVQGGRRRGANMGILRCDHPDIFEFVQSKLSEDVLSNFNISVAVTDSFINAVKKNSDHYLVNPRTKKKVSSVKSRVLFDLIVNSAWQTGDPGLIYLNEINRKNPTPQLGALAATNPCGELPLLAYESCNLASINLSKFVKEKAFQWDKLKYVIFTAVRFLDDVIEVNKYPLPQIGKVTLGNRKIGLGVMGFADMLIGLGLPYNSKAAIVFSNKLMKFIRHYSLMSSIQLANERGVFPNYKKSIYVKKNIKLRNATLNSIAPTGTISIIAGCSSGIEPLFAISFVRNVLSGTKLLETHPLLETYLKEKGICPKDIMPEIMKEGSLRNIKHIPDEIKKIFLTTFDISSFEHLKIQAVFQAKTDNAVSKTINLHRDASVEEVKKIYLLAHRLKCKGITIYRYGTKKRQVLTVARKQINEKTDELSDGSIVNQQ